MRQTLITGQKSLFLSGYPYKSVNYPKCIDNNDFLCIIKHNQY